MKLYDSTGRKFINEGSHAVYADVESVCPIIDVHKQSKKSGGLNVTASGLNFNYDMFGSDFKGNVESLDTKPANATDVQSVSGPGIELDFNQWLPFAAPKYKISPDIKDYVIVPVIAVPSDLPNRNRVAFPLKQLLAFNPDMGCQAYRTWVGKPTYSEHKNDVIEEAYGVIIDTSMVKLNGWAGGKMWKLLMLAAFDRSKYVERVADIASKTVNSYSMGAWVESYTCSVCGCEVGKCNHVPLKDSRSRLTESNGRLAFKNCEGIVGFELSVVNTPAWVSAISDKVDFLDG